MPDIDGPPSFSPLVVESSGATPHEDGEDRDYGAFSPLVVESSGATWICSSEPRYGSLPFSPLVVESSGATWICSSEPRYGSLPFSPLVVESSGATQEHALCGTLCEGLSVLSSSSQAVQLTTSRGCTVTASLFQSSSRRVKRCNGHRAHLRRRHVMPFSPLVVESSGATSDY